MNPGKHKQTESLPAISASEIATSVARAATILARGGLVAFPTETVYGLGADARSEEAVQGIFRAKGRPSNNPLIVHCSSISEARRWTTGWNDTAEQLAQAFWPGPLTLVLPLGGGIAPSVVAGGNTVGLRVPGHPVALALLRETGIPIAAPSANLSNRISPTSAEAVLEQLRDRIDAVIDGGPCRVGIESTVLDLCSDQPRMLRPGTIGAPELATVLGRSLDATQAAGPTLRSPGMLPIHYAPQIPLILGGPPMPDAFRIRFGPEPSFQPGLCVLKQSPDYVATHLYATLRAAENSGADMIHIQEIPTGSEWDAIRDRVRRASSRHQGNP